MQGAKGAALAKLVADKGKTKSKDEEKRAEVTAKVQSIFDATEADVKKILDGIDPKVEKEFDAGEKAARAKFESYVSAKMSAYKKDRYGGWTRQVPLGSGTRSRGCPTRSTSSTWPAASSTSRRWTRPSPRSPTSSATT